MKIAQILLAILFAAALVACAHGGDATSKIQFGHIVTDDGVRLHYTSMGDGEEVLVAPVGFYLEPYLLAPLSENRRVIMYDPRNRGRSEAGPLASASLDRQVQDLENLRTALGIEKMALLGWSGLGMEMAVYTIRHRERVTRLVQMSAVPPAAAIMAENGDQRADSVDNNAMAALDARAEAGEFDEAPETYCRLSNELTLPSNFVDSSLARDVVDVCIYENEWPKNLWPYFGAFLPSFADYDWREEMRDLKTPRLVLHGREDGIPLKGAIAWAAGYENTRLLVLSPSGHFPFIEQRDATVSALNTFLNGEWPDKAEVILNDAGAD